MKFSIAPLPKFFNGLLVKKPSSKAVSGFLIKALFEMLSFIYCPVF